MCVITILNVSCAAVYSSRKQEIQAVSGADPFKEFYDRYRGVLAYHKQVCAILIGCCCFTSGIRSGGMLKWKSAYCGIFVCIYVCVCILV